jgi:hypothetical protein
MMAGVKLAVALLVLLLAGCSSSSDPSPAPATDDPGPTWIGMVPGDAIAYHGPAGELVLIYVDETYTIGDVNASALTWKLGEDDYTTDYFVEEDDGTIQWYGRRGSWRAGRHGEEPRAVPIVNDEATFGDRTITLSDDGGPVQLETPEGVFTPK